MSASIIYQVTTMMGLYGYGPMGMGWGGMFGGVGLVFMLLFWILIFVALYLLIRALVGHQKCECGSMHHYRGDQHMSPGGPTPMHDIKKTKDAVNEMQKKMDENPAFRILQERYAKGELTREQYEEMKRNLMG